MNGLYSITGEHVHENFNPDLEGLTLFMLILEEGTHETLLARQGRYYELYSTQASYYS